MHSTHTKMGKPTLIVAFFLLFLFLATAQTSIAATAAPFHVGAILDLETLVGKMGRASISMAIEDFYAAHRNYTTRLVVHTRNSNNDVVQAASEDQNDQNMQTMQLYIFLAALYAMNFIASPTNHLETENPLIDSIHAAINLLEKVRVQAIIGPQKSNQVVFVSDLGNKTQVPIVSFSATSLSLSSIHTPYFVRTTLNDSSQMNAISSIIKAFRWREAVLIYEDTDYGRDAIPYLVDSLQAVDARVPYRSVIPLTATSNQIMEELYKLMTMQTRVFIVHMSLSIGARLFAKAKEAGMMSEGYAWIMTDGLSNIIDSFESSIIDSMQGVLGVKPYVSRSRELNDFNIRWKKRFQQENPSDQPAELSMFAVWAYDTVWTLAMAAEKVGATNYSVQKQNPTNDSMGLGALGVSMSGPKLLKAILENRFRGLSGEFHLIDGQLQLSSFQIINVVRGVGRGIGFWTPTYGISRQLNYSRTHTFSTLQTDLNPIIWPGESYSVPKGWQIPTSGKKLRIGVPVRKEFDEFVKVERDPLSNFTSVSGFCIDVFEAVIKKLPYDISYEYIPFENAEGNCAGTYNDLIYNVYLQNYDAVVGDTTIRANRSLYVDFTLPFTESGVSMLVPVKTNINKNAWIFLKPLSLDLWLGSLAFFLLTGFVVWVMEHRINTEFRGPVSQQLGTLFYFSFSTLVFAHKENIENILSKIVVIVWVFVVLILTSSYTASLTSMLTVQQLEPTVTTIYELLKNGDYVGYHNSSFVEGLLKELHFDKSKLKSLDFSEDYVEALSKGSKNGGVSAIIHEAPYLKLFLAQHCTGYTMIGPFFKTAGFGFVFPRGSPLVSDISRAIMAVTEENIMAEIERKWLGDQTACLNQGSSITSNNLTFRSFGGLFLITGVTSACALLIFLAMFFYKNWHELKNIDPDKPIFERLLPWLKYYHQRDLSSYTFKREKSKDANGFVNQNMTYGINMAALIDDLENRLRIPNLSFVDPDPRVERSPPGLASPCSEAEVLSIVVTR